MKDVYQASDLLLWRESASPSPLRWLGHGVAWSEGQVVIGIARSHVEKHGDADVGSLHPLAVEANRAGLDRLKPVEPLVLGPGAAKAEEGGIQGRRSLISGMVVATMGIGLPDFHQRIGNREPVAIQDVSF